MGRAKPSIVIVTYSKPVLVAVVPPTTEVNAVENCRTVITELKVVPGSVTVVPGIVMAVGGGKAVKVTVQTWPGSYISKTKV